MTYRAERCRCGHPVCKDWHVSDVAEMQGVKFTQEQAELVARVLNNEDAATCFNETSAAEVSQAMKAIGISLQTPFILVVMPRNIGPSASVPRGHSFLWSMADLVVEWFDGKFHIVKEKVR